MTSEIKMSRFDVEKFNGSQNFGIWQRKIMALLVHQGLHKAISKEGKPEDMKKCDWDELDLKASSTILLCLADEVINNVAEAKTASEMWEKLEILYMSKSLCNKLFLLRQLYSLRMKDGTPLMTHLNAFNKLVQDLLRIGKTIEDEDQAMILLSSLPSSYDHMVTTICYGKTTLKMEEVTSALLTSDILKKPTIEEESSTLAAAVYVRGKGKAQEGGWVKSKSKVVCWICKEEGHMKRDCPKRGKNVEDSSMMAVDTTLGGEGDFLIVEKGIGTSSLDWFLDSGCSFHVCSRKEWFASFKAKKGGIARLGDGTACKITGVGTVKIRMYDGTVRTLGGVRYAPRLRRNLISLGTLDSGGCSFSAQGGALEVVRGPMLVMIGEKCGSNLYRLVGNTIEGGVPKGAVRRRQVRGGGRRIRSVDLTKNISHGLLSSGAADADSSKCGLGCKLSSCVPSR